MAPPSPPQGQDSQCSVRPCARHALSSVAMSIAASAAAEVAERERERARRCDAALAPLREAVARASGQTPEEAAADERLWHVVQAAFEVDRNIVNLNNG